MSRSGEQLPAMAAAAADPAGAGIADPEPDAAPGRTPTVICIAGSGRSGSTLLERMLPDCSAAVWRRRNPCHSSCPTFCT
jgi:hypothetical protein